MNIKLEIIKENEDGSALCEVEMDEAAKRYLMERGFIIMLQTALDKDPDWWTEQDEKRKVLNTFIRSSPIFAGVIDFDVVTLDVETGQMKPEYVPDSTIGGPGDRLHPNRAGYHAMGDSIDLEMLVATNRSKPKN